MKDYQPVTMSMALPNLDVLRAFAVGWVLIAHLIPTLVFHCGFDNRVIISLTKHYGRAGVLAFFVHTSLVLMYSLERLERQNASIVWRFYVRRLFRIYPLSIICVCLVVALGIPPMTSDDSPPISAPSVVVANLLLVQNVITKESVIVPLWSLPYEVQMYLVLPLLYYLARPIQGPYYIALAFSVMSAVGLAIYVFTGHMNMAGYAPCFLCGVLCYSLRDRLRPQFPAATWPWFLLLLSVGYSATVTKADLAEGNNSIGWIYCLLLGMAIPLFKQSSSRWANQLTSKMALYSYGLYLSHVPTLYLVFVVWKIKDPWLGSGLFVAITAVASIATYYLIENPLIEVGRRISESTDAKSTVGRRSA